MEDPFPNPTAANAMIERARTTAAEKENLLSIGAKLLLNIKSQFLSRPGAIGLLDASFLSSMNGNLIRLLSTVICWALLAHSTGHFVKPAIYKRQLSTWMTNFPEAELEGLIREEIVRQALNRARKSSFSVPESGTTEARPDPAPESLIEGLRSNHVDALAQSQARQLQPQKQYQISDTGEDSDNTGDDSPRHPHKPQNASAKSSAAASDQEHEDDAENDELDDRGPTIETIDPSDFSDVSSELD
ncbi:hypothetical protein Q9L58_008696 [Maublancomyces gigas]|uniref:Uncharacterized protein n=1 Tax=Discina gigas TaxID=1032678 RepID=A0ABR3G9G1_9PEZI